MTRSIALLGSGEFETWASDVDTWLISSAGTDSKRVLILPTASAPEGDEVFENWGAMGLTHYQRLGATPEVLPLKTREDAHNPLLVDRIEDAALTFFSGGNPAYLARTLTGTPFWETLVAAVERGMSLGGCSAGAVFLGGLAPDTTGSDRKTIRWMPGLSYFPEIMFAPHWNALDTYVPGLTDLVKAATPQGWPLVTIDEETAMFGDGNEWSVHGKGKVTIHTGNSNPVTYGAGETIAAGLIARRSQKQQETS